KRQLWDGCTVCKYTGIVPALASVYIVRTVAQQRRRYAGFELAAYLGLGGGLAAALLYVGLGSLSRTLLGDTGGSADQSRQL
ncbi:hypothetical protein BOX15_Mlig030784g5, partial [Macrostomum lignano]